MKNTNGNPNISFASLMDLSVMVACFLFAALVTSSDLQGLGMEGLFSMQVTLRDGLVFVCFVLVWGISFSGYRLYTRSRRDSLTEEAFNIFKAVTIGTLAIVLLSFIIRVTYITPAFAAMFWTSGLTATALGRLLSYYLLKRARAGGMDTHNMLIVGINQRSLHFASEMKERLDHNYNIIGFVDDDPVRIEYLKKTGFQLVAGLNDFAGYLRGHVVDEVAVCLPLKSFYQQDSAILSACQEQGIMVRFLADLFNLKRGHAVAEPMGDDAVITIYDKDSKVVQSAVKRAVDVAASSAAILMLSPLIVLAALAVRLTSPGPALFVQERLGLNKRMFRMYKFRTMVVDAEKKLAELEGMNEAEGPVFKIREDPRITPLGRFLRKSSIDELPQLFNVLKGDISLVGPRPLPVRDYNGFDKDWHRRRFSVRPGITCLWQISGRNNIPFEKWMELDMHYIDNWSLWYDFKILLKTVPVVIRGSGAS